MNKNMLNSELVRKKTIELSCTNNAGHLAPSLSTVEILTVLFKHFLKYNTDNPQDENRDILILSKGHGCYAYYIILNMLKFIPDYELENFYKSSTIKGCLTQNSQYMIEASTGSLGHGLPIAVGMAQAFKMQKKENKVICIVGDGEMQEGSNFEALNLAYRFKLDNLLLIVDANNLQAMDEVKNVALDNDRLAKILQSYTKNFSRINGHNEKALFEGYFKFFHQASKNFSVLFCDTIKGYGVSVCENSIKHHFRVPTEDGYRVEDE